MSFLPSTTSVRNLNLAAAANDVCDVEDKSNRYTNTTIRGVPFPRELDSLDSPLTSSTAFMGAPDYSAFPSSSSSRDFRRHRRSFRCVCGRRVDSDSGMYCSPDCARQDAFSSLTHTRNNSTTHPDRDHSFEVDDYDTTGSRHRRAVRADPYRTDLTREERRRKQRADGNDSISPMSARNLMLSPSVPELVSSHSRNTSTASSVFSLSSMSSSMSLSRNPSTSSRNVALNSVILEDARENLSSDRSTLRASRRTHSLDNDAPPSKRLAVNDMLDEIISMENELGDDMDAADIHADFEMPSTPEHVAFSPVIRPPRTPTPPPVAAARSPPGAPGAPDRRRGSLVRSRPMSNLAAHASSLSESHTALYLATASPVASPPPASSSKKDLRRSASPKLHIRRSISFTPQAAGPALAAPPRSRYNDSPGLTPVRRSKTDALRATIDAWRFPTSSSSPAVLEIEGTTPTATSRLAEPQTPIHFRPSLLWPQSHQVPEEPEFETEAASPNSPSFGMNLPRHQRSTSNKSMSPPRSSRRLGALLGLSGSASDMDMDEPDDANTLRGRPLRLQAPAAPW